MRYTKYIDTIADVADEILVVNGFLDMLQFLRLLLTSKQLRNKINVRPSIAQHIRTTLGIPIERMRNPTKVLTFFRIRSGASELPRSLCTEYGLAIQHCCAMCLNHEFRTRRVDKWHLSKDRKWVEGDFLFTNGLEKCATCEALPSWRRGLAKCYHPSHIEVRHRIHNQVVCHVCFRRLEVLGSSTDASPPGRVPT